MTLRKIATIIGSKPTTVRYTIKAYEQFGRTNKLLTVYSKQKLISQRNMYQLEVTQKNAPANIFKVIRKANVKPFDKELK